VSAESEAFAMSDQNKIVESGSAAWVRGCGKTRCSVEWIGTRHFKWRVVRWEISFAPAEEGVAETFFQALWAAQRAADVLEG